jgi:signal transduction histidine kinase
MGDVLRILDTVTATLLCSSLAALGLRLPACRGRRESAWLAGLLAVLALRTVVPFPDTARMILSLGTAWLAGAFASRASGRRVGATWHACSAVPAAVVIAALAAGLGGSFLLPAFHAFSMAFLAALCVPALARAWTATRSVPLAAACAAGALWAGTSVAALLAGPASGAGSPLLLAAAAARALLAGSLGALILLQGYPWSGGFAGRAAGSAARARMLAPIFARLLETEGALARQEALAASGFLALGAAHEFKNSLALVRAAAEVGLSSAVPAEKDESLRLVLEQSAAGSGAAVAFLERLAREGREEERVLDARAELEGLLRVCRATVRPEGIAIRAELEEGVRFLGRPAEVARIVLSLVENAVQCLRARGQEGGAVRVSARGRDRLAVVEVRDNAGGVPAEAAALLFTAGSSSTGSTGVGLYIARSLAERGGGTLTHAPIEGGSCFSLCFPLADREPPVA